MIKFGVAFSETLLLRYHASGTVCLLIGDIMTSYGQFGRHPKSHLFRVFAEITAHCDYDFVRYSILRSVPDRK